MSRDLLLYAQAVEELDRIVDAVARPAPNGANHGRFQASGSRASVWSQDLPCRRLSRMDPNKPKVRGRSPGPVVLVDTDVGRAGIGDVLMDGGSGRDDVQDTGPWGFVLRRHRRDSRLFQVPKGAVLRIKLL